MPVKPLPKRPDLDHLKSQAKDLLIAYRHSDKAAIQRVREFHPRISPSDQLGHAAHRFTLSDAQLAIAREYGIASWPRLHTIVCEQTDLQLELPHHDRIDDPDFRRAVDLIDEGHVEALRTLISTLPQLLHQRVEFVGVNYFQKPYLLEFVAENPIRHAQLPDNIVDVTRLLLDLGAKDERDAIDQTLALVCSGRIVRECGVQQDLIDLLCDYDANADDAIMGAIAHGEFHAVTRLIDRGAEMNLVIACALGNCDAVQQMLPGADDETRHQALSMCTQFGHEGPTRLLLEAGEDPSRFNPPGFHAHSTPLHQAALAGHEDIVRLLIQYGADPTMRDILHNATPAGWATHGPNSAIADFLDSLG